MNLLGKNILYINGCSFVAGNRLADNEVLSQVLGNKLKYDIIDESANGQSFESSFINTVCKLSSIKKANNSLVVIGLTWEPRYAIQFKQGIVSITPADIRQSTEKPKTFFGEKYSTWRRLVSPYFIDVNQQPVEIRELNEELEQENSIHTVLSNFTRYYESLIEHDSNLTDNQILNVLTKILTLQSYLKNNNINYFFLDFKGYTKNPYIFTKQNENKFPIKELKNQLDTLRILDFTNEYFKNNFIDKDTSHPSADGVKYIANLIVEKLNEL